MTPGGTEGDGGVSRGEVTLIRADTPIARAQRLGMSALSGGGLDLGTFIEYPSVSVENGGPGFLLDYQKRKSRSARKEMSGVEEIPSDPILWGNRILEEKEDGDDVLLPGGIAGFKAAQETAHELRE